MVEVCEDSFSNAISLALQECERLVVICNTPSATWADVVRAWDAIESVWNDTLAFPVMLSDFGFASAAIDGVQPEVLRLKRFEMETWTPPIRKHDREIGHRGHVCHMHCTREQDIEGHVQWSTAS